MTNNCIFDQVYKHPYHMNLAEPYCRPYIIDMDMAAFFYQFLITRIFITAESRILRLIFLLCIWSTKSSQLWIFDKKTLCMIKVGVFKFPIQSSYCHKAILFEIRPGVKFLRQISVGKN